MSLSKNQLIADIRGMATSGGETIDFRIEDSQISFWIDQCRATLISQALQRKSDINDTWLQTITCLDLIQVDKSDCCDITTNCVILRTQLQLPETIDTQQDNFIVRVESINGDLISKTTILAVKYNNFAKYTSNKPKWFLKNNYIYIINSEFLGKINVTAIWDTPADLYTFENCNGIQCYSINDQYPCNQKMASMITDIVFKSKIMPYMQMPQDNTNDANNNLQTSNPTK